MPRTRSLAYSELKIGIIAVFAIVVAATVIFMLSNRGGFFWQRYHLKARFGDVAGLIPGSPVRLAGVEVGSVTDIRFAGAEVEAVLEISREIRDRVTRHSTASIGSMGLLGQSTVEITASATGEPIPEWGYVPGGRGGGQIADVAESATRSLEEARALLRDVRAGKGTIGRLFTDENLYRELQGFVASAENVASRLDRGRGTIPRLLNDPAAYRSLEESLRTFNAMVRRVNAGEGSLGRLLQDEAFAQSATSTAQSLDSLTARLNRGEGTAGKLVTDPALYNRLNAVAERLDRLTGRLTEGQGTAGQLLQDRQLYENMNAAASELRALIGDIRKDPRKYLSVKVSVF